MPIPSGIDQSKMLTFLTILLPIDRVNRESAMATLDRINSLSPAEFSALFGKVYEHSGWIAERAFGRRPFASETELLLALWGAVQAASAREQLALLNAHPELAGREAQAGTLTDASKNEQRLAGLGTLDDAQRAELGALNRRYLEQFGFPFIICARLNSREAIFGSLRARLTNAPEHEMQNALAQVGQIAQLRLLDILRDA